MTESSARAVGAVAPPAPLSGKKIRKGTGDVLKDLDYAQQYMDEFCEGDFPGRIALELRFVERALRVAANEIRQLRERLKLKPAPPSLTGDAPQEE